MTAPRYALFGSPVDRSPSPAMHNAAFAHLGIDASYHLREAGREDIDALVAELDDGTWRGANVTTPLKTQLAPRVQAVGAAQRAGAVNTLVLAADGWEGHLTDVEGVETPIRNRDPVSWNSGHALILGAGGAARAAALAVEALGLPMFIAARREEAAEELITALDLSEARGVELSVEDLATIVSDVRLVIQSTPVGREGEHHPLDWNDFPDQGLVFEMVYSPRRTPFLDDAKAHGWEGIEGWEMLLAQGAAAFSLWTGEPAPVEVMRQAILGHLDGG